MLQYVLYKTWSSAYQSIQPIIHGLSVGQRSLIAIGDSYIMFLRWFSNADVV